MTRALVVTVRASRQLDGLFDYLAANASPDTARRYIDAILDRIEGLLGALIQGTARDDILPGLRTLGFRRRVTIAFRVEEANVVLLGVFYGGQDFQSRLRQP